MVALTSDRNTVRLQGDKRRGPVAASQVIYAGAMVMLNAAGNLVKGATATGLVGVGRAEERVDNSAGIAGAKSIDYLPGVFRFANSTATDEITAADIGSVCYAVDDQTVAKTHATNTRSPAGTVEGLDEHGVWVRFDPALTKAALS